MMNVVPFPAILFFNCEWRSAAMIPKPKPIQKESDREWRQAIFAFILFCRMHKSWMRCNYALIELLWQTRELTTTKSVHAFFCASCLACSNNKHTLIWEEEETKCFIIILMNSLRRTFYVTYGNRRRGCWNHASYSIIKRSVRTV